MLGVGKLIELGLTLVNKFIPNRDDKETFAHEETVQELKARKKMAKIKAGKPSDRLKSGDF